MDEKAGRKNLTAKIEMSRKDTLFRVDKNSPCGSDERETRKEKNFLLSNVELLRDQKPGRKNLNVVFHDESKKTLF